MSHQTKNTKRNKIEILEVKGKITKMKNVLGGFNKIFKQSEERTSKYKHGSLEVLQVKQQKGKKMKKNKESPKDLWETIKDTNIWIMCISE